MANRYRRIRQKVSFTEDEYDIIRGKMAQAEETNFDRFARSMLLEGQVNHIDFHQLKELTSQLSHLSGSINQIAKRCNETKSIYRSEVDELRRQYMEVKAIVQGQLVKLLRRL